MKFNLLSREECLEITKKSEAFYVSKRNHYGFDIEMYDYRLASYLDFFPENENRNNTELRGLTFIFDKEKNVWNQHIAMNKFFNVNQTINWMIEDLKNKKIVAISDKRDGSLILPVKLPNGDIVMKTKMAFTSDQANAAQVIYNTNKNYQEFIKYCEENGIQTMFEYTSFDNQIVLSYSKKELVLLQARFKETGKYLNDIELVNISEKFNIPLTEQYNVEYLNEEILKYYTILSLNQILFEKRFNTFIQMVEFLEEYIKENELDVLNENISTLDFLLLTRNYITDEEGFVVTFEDGQMAKIKHLKYLQLHGLTTEATRENLLIQTILEDNIDDVISQLLEGEKKDFIISITKKVTKKFNHSIVEVQEMLKDFNGDHKEFALKYSKNELFSIAMRCVSNPIESNISKNLKEFFIKQTNGLDKAKKWLENIPE